MNYDIMDEVGAHNAQNSGSSLRSGANRNAWGDANETERIETLQNTPAYSRLPVGPVNNTNTQKVKSPMFYMLPKKER